MALRRYAQIQILDRTMDAKSHQASTGLAVSRALAPSQPYHPEQLREGQRGALEDDAERLGLEAEKLPR